MYMYILYKFGGLLSVYCAVNAAQLCVQASISTRINSSTFTRGSTFVFRYYLLGGDTAMPGGLYTGLCHAFLVIITQPESSYVCLISSH